MSSRRYFEWFIGECDNIGSMSSIAKFVVKYVDERKMKRVSFEDYHDYEMHVLTSDSIILHHNSENINDQIINLLNQVCSLIFLLFKE